MEAPPEVTFQHVDPTDEQRGHIFDRIAKLERYCDHITTCSVAVSREQRQADTGDRFRARIRLHVPPNHEIIGEHSPSDSSEKVDMNVAVNHAFSTVERQLRKLTERQNEKH